MAKQKEQSEEVVKTGYEGTGKEDTFNQVGDDVVLPGTEEEPVEKKKDEDVPGKPVEKSAAETELLKKIEEQEREQPPNNDDEFSFLETEEEKEKVEEKEEKEQSEETDVTAEKEIDIFETEDLETELAQIDQQKQEAVKFDWIAYAKKEFDLEIAENKPELLSQAISKKIEDSAQKVVPDTSKYSPDAKAVVEHLENNGSIEDIINPLAQLDEYIATTDADDLIKDYYVAYEQLSETDADAKLEELHDDDNFDTKLSEVKKILFKHRQNKVSEILQLSKDKIEKQRTNVEAQALKERNEMIRVVDEMTEFMGMPLPDKAKNYIKSEISKGLLSEKNNNARTQVSARFYDLFGKQIIDMLNKKTSDEARKSFTTAKEKELAALHNIKPKGEAGSAQEHRTVETPTNPLAYFIDIEKDAIEVD